MDPGAFDHPVTLVIKAPNQKYKDQTISCFLNWTVEKLKSHISKVYPSRPLSKDQRLVYSGRLLQDHMQLRDVLRKQDEYHMMHLVCASHSPPPSPSPSTQSMASPSMASSSMSSDGAGSASPASSPQQDSQPASSSSVTGSYEGVRYRGGGLPGAPQWPNVAQVPLHGGLPANVQAGVPPNAAYLPMQMLWWQQMYARHYYMQYAAAVAAAQTPPSSPPPSSLPPSSSPLQPAQPNDAVQAPRGPNPEPNPLPENPPANANIQMNAQGGAVLNEDDLNRDWLDWLYTVSRAGVLLSIVYFYSSFSRFVMVVGAMLLVYLHQAGWFPFRLEQQNPRGADQAGADQAGAAQDDAERHQDIQEMERLMDEGVEDDDSGEEGGGGGQDDPAVVPEPSFLATAWSFISTFFTSLIPEGRPQAAN